MTHRLLTFILFTWLITNSLFVVAQTGSWRAYMSYYEPQQIVKAGNYLFVRASNDLYSYNLNDHSIQTYDKVNYLSDNVIDYIAWNPTVKKLLIIYQNKNIDLLTPGSNDVFNVSAYYAKSMTQNKTINAVYIYQQYAYLSTAFGIVKLNMQRQEIAESYILNMNITTTAVKDGSVYARRNDGYVYAGKLTANLIDPSNWTLTTDYDTSIFDVSTADWDEYIETVKTLQPGGPKYNLFGFMRLKNNRLYTVGGGFSAYSETNYPATVQVLDNDNWQLYQDDMTGVEGTEEPWWFVCMLSVDVDPRDERHVFACGRTGLYEYYDGALRKYYNINNSILDSAVAGNNYVLVEGCAFDPSGNLWMLQSQVANNNIVCLQADGKMVSLKLPELMNNGLSWAALRNPIIDSSGRLWFVNEYWDKQSFICYDPWLKSIVRQITKTITNQDGTSYTDFVPHCVTEDLDGNIWLGCSMGAFLLEKNKITAQGEAVTQVKVPRNDGTDLADYLLSGVNITCIVVDGANRKWFGTQDNGIYLISSDNLTQIHHFTEDNSPLLSNQVKSMAINNATGELFIGSDIGLCSFTTDATEAVEEMSKNDVYAFPNPVPADYNGLITVRGLAFDSDVKILTSSGRLVASGRSNGGTFTWNGRDTSGRRVASGVYMICVAKGDGSNGVVGKIAMIK